MARQSSRSSSSGRSSGFGSRSASPNYSNSGTASRTQQRPQQPAQTQSHPPVQQSTGGGMMGGIGSTIMTGMAFGGGSEIGHQVVRSMMGGNSHSQEGKLQQEQPMQNQQQNQNQNQQQRQNPCTEFNSLFVNCLKTNDNNISTCQPFFDDFKSCEKSLI